MTTPSAKYPRTLHVPWSLGATTDDKMLSSVEHFVEQECVLLEKLDGENQCWTDSEVYARSHAAQVSHASNGVSKREHSMRRHLIDPALSVFHEYTYAMHSIWYRRMAAERSYCHLFNVRHDTTGVFWAWDDVEMMAQHLDLPTAPVLWRGVVESEEHLRSLMAQGGESAWGGVPVRWNPETRLWEVAPGGDPNGNIREGLVLRLAGEFADLGASVAKLVRPNHVQTGDHWKRHWVPMSDWSPEGL